MIADIFYPTFTLTITVLVCFIQKKNFFVGFAPIPSTGHHLGHSGELTAPPRPPASILFGFSKNQCTHIFSVLSRLQFHSTNRKKDRGIKKGHPGEEKERISVFRGGLLICWERGGNFFRRGCSFHIKNKLKSQIFNNKKS